MHKTKQFNYCKRIVNSEKIQHNNKKSTTFGMSLNTKKSINTSSNKRCGRMLGAKEKNRMREQNYANLQKRIKILLDEDDSTFGERLNKLTHDDKFKKRFNKVLQDDLFQEKCNRMMKDKHFRQKFSELNNNNNCESQFFSPLDDSNNNVEENSDPFKYFNNLEEYFDELKSKNDNKEKIMNALRRHNSCASIPNGDTKRTTKNKRKQYRETKSVPTERAPTESVETVYVETESVETLFYEAECDEPQYDTPSKIRRNNDLERSIEPYKYKGVVEVKPFSDLPDIIKDMDSLFESEVIRYYKLRSENKGRYSYKGQDNFGKLLSFLSKNRVFIPLLSIPITVFIVSTLFTPFGAALVGSTALTFGAAVATSSVTSGSILGTYYLRKFSKLSKRSVKYKRTSPQIKFADN
ncbi:unnamed protein product [Plasmodium vivax]|uniref:(malaria parasite P. vivax) hypothetical protein n=1 Tax=Plasmodium vivax TaxID=5855 RepID=A0A564ZRV6_PLAVI|nr:unnamed protein product [Plasmodium vivax]VUZ94629.1 Plasmodium exported protein, unknown function [Plasmodium vivax]